MNIFVKVTLNLALRAEEHNNTNSHSMFKVFLDTNIYRSLGLNFTKHRDHESLHKFLALSGHLFLMLPVVRAEILDYFERDVFGKLISDYQRLVKEYEDNPFLRKLPSPDFEKELEEAFRLLNISLGVARQVTVDEDIPSSLLTSFLLCNKKENRGDNARDFIIFYHLLGLCEKNPDDTIVLISQDKIFRNNTFFLELIKKHRISNFRVLNSIPAFLSEVGIRVEWLNEKVIAAQINTDIIYNEILSDVKCLPSYTSQFYYDRKETQVPELMRLNLNGYSIRDFYVYQNEETGVLALNVDLRVEVIAVFGDDPYPDELAVYLDTKPQPSIGKPEKFDAMGHLIYDDDILFMFEGEIDLDGQKILNFHFVDFMPAFFRYDGWKPGPAFKILPIEP